MVQDIRQALRLLTRTPGLTAAAILSLAITIGITGVVFTALKAVIIDPLPYKRANDLVVLRSFGANANWVSYADMVDVRQRSRTLESVGIYHYSLLNLKGEGSSLPQAIYGLRVSPELFPLLGVSPMLGRNIALEEGTPGHGHVMILSYGLWKRRYNLDPHIVGRTMIGNGYPYTIIGVMPPGFDFPLRIASTIKTPASYMEFWEALADKPTRAGGYGAVARLRPGVTRAEVSQDLGSIAKSLEREYPAADRNLEIHALSLEGQTFGKTRAALLILMAASALFMLIGCSNVANLLLARATARQREIAVRVALGAGRGRLVRQLVTESCVLAMVGGVSGYVLTLAAWRIVPAVLASTIPRIDSGRPDWAVFAFVLGASVINGLIFGIFPALQMASHNNPAIALRESGARGSAGAGRSRLRSVFVISEMAITMVLVIAGGMLLTSFIRLLRTDLGFRTDHVLASIIVPLGETYQTPAQRAVFFRRLLDAVPALPGVESEGLVDALPFSGENTGATIRTGAPDEAPNGKAPIAECNRVTAGYLETMGIRLLRGRSFRREDEAGGANTAIIDENAARRFFPGQDPIGKRICINCEPGQPVDWRQIVGVVNPVKHYSVQADAGESVYVASKALEAADFLVLRTRGPAMDVAAPLRRMAASLDPNVPIYLSAEMSTLVGDSISDKRFVMALLGATGILALLLAAAGVYAVVSYATAQRTREIGIRVALGATRANVRGLVLRDGMRTAAIGVGIGLVLGLVVTRLLRAFLTGLSVGTGATIALAVVLVTATALAACLLPARRATRVDPMTALRHE